MQLLYEILLVSGPAAAAAAAMLAKRLRKPKPPPPPPPEEEEKPEVSSPPPTPPPQPPQPSPRRLTDDELVEEVITHIAFSTKQIQVGVKEIGRRVIGHRAVVSDVPEDDFDIRPMVSPSERLSLLPGESTKPNDVALIRLLTGQAMVMEPLRAEEITEPITRPVMRTLRHTVYVLLDISGSMYHTPWRSRIGKGVALGLSRRCRKEESTFLFRPFCESVRPLSEVADDAQQAGFEAHLARLSSGDGTAIGPAISQAIVDCLAQNFDSCDIMIITDGEDEALNVDALRAQLAMHKIRLHAILLDVNNAALQQIANVYQQIPEPGVLRAPIIRAS